MGIDTSICEKSSHGELHNPLHEGHTGEANQSQNLLSRLSKAGLLLVMDMQWQALQPGWLPEMGTLGAQAL